MIIRIKIFCYFVFCISQLIFCNQKLTPILFYHNAFKGSDWIYEDKQVTIFGAGIKGYFSNKNWSIKGTYIQFGFWVMFTMASLIFHHNKVLHILMTRKMQMDIGVNIWTQR